MAQQVMHARELGLDAGRGGNYNAQQAVAGQRLESVVGPLTSSDHPGADWVDKYGTTYEGLGPVPKAYFDLGDFTNALAGHLAKGADRVVVDLMGLTTEQIAGVQAFIAGLPQQAFSKILILY